MTKENEKQVGSGHKCHLWGAAFNMKPQCREYATKRYSIMSFFRVKSLIPIMLTTELVGGTHMEAE